MNAASSLGLPAMEDPFTDTMEMASPYNGHVDDFEIDIDIMDDQPANVDNDFDLQDATPDGASGEFTHDADMMDDVPEMTVTDTSAYNNDGNMQYTDITFSTTHEPVESEMVDEEYEDNTDAAPTSFETIQAPQGEVKLEETVEVVNEQQAVEEERKGQEQQNDDKVAEEAQTAVHKIGSQELNQEGLVEAKVDAPHTAADPQVEAAAEHHLENPADVNEPVEEINEQAAVTKQGAEHDAAEEADVENGLNDLPPAGEIAEAVENEHNSPENTPYLHQVKVIYQESEISMFPPRHGNTSETYFLADEGLAHENIDRLFKECRAILGDHASSEDSLVFHIDSLGIELSEDSTHVSKVTLSQIVDTYLHLCRNSGIEQPEPLYLSLSTRAHLSSELAALLNAAKEGKGISDIQTWEEEYEHEETEDAGVSSRAELSEQNVNERDREEHTHLAEEGLQNEGLDSEPAESRDHEGQVYDNTQHDDQDRLVDTHELHQAGVETTDFQQYNDEEEDGELNTANDDSYQFAETQANLEQPDNVEENEHLQTSKQEPTTECEYQQQEGLTSGPGVDETVAADTGIVGDDNQEYPADEHAVVPDSHVEQDDRQEEEASTEDNRPAAELTEASEDANAAEQYNETGGYEDEEETAGQEESAEEGEYDEDAGEENYEDYAEEEYRQDDLQHEDNEKLDGDEHTEDFQEGQNDGSYAADQFDQASSKTVSASNEPVDKNDDLPDNFQTGTKTDAPADLDYTQEIPDLPDLPDDDLLDLDDDIFADTEQATHRETEDGNGPDVSVEQVATINDEQQNVQLKRQGSTVGKRPRSDEEEEIDFDGVPSPGAKRTRSS